MKLHSWICTALVLVFMPFYLLVPAQEYDSELLTRRIYAKINQVNDNISVMSDKSMNVSTREYYKNKALSLFYNHGENYLIHLGVSKKRIR